jgi:hypothetical protein
LWTTEFHHGQFLQTSISRPGLEEWEDESGPMPSHITGLTLEHDIERSNNSTIGISLAAGLGAKFEGQELVPFDFLDSKSDHDFALNYRMTYRPDLLSINQIGIALAWNDISVISESSPDLTDLRAIRQTTISLFADWSWADWRLLTNWVYFHNEMRYFDTNIDDKFASSYVQVEYKTANDWTLFGRAEFSISEDDSRYLRLLPDFISNRYMLGLRWDFADTQSLTLETAKTKTQGVDGIHNRFNELRFQWSAVFP